MMQMDVSFILILFLSALSGMLLLALRETAAMGTLLAIHLGIIAAFFLMIPYGKLAHVVYRYSALVKNAVEQRRAAAAEAAHGTATDPQFLATAHMSSRLTRNVMLSVAKHLTDASGWVCEILRCAQDDKVWRSRWQGAPRVRGGAPAVHGLRGSALGRRALPEHRDPGLAGPVHVLASQAARKLRVAGLDGRDDLVVLGDRLGRPSRPRERRVGLAKPTDPVVDLPHEQEQHAVVGGVAERLVQLDVQLGHPTVVCPVAASRIWSLIQRSRARSGGVACSAARLAASPSSAARTA